MADRNGLRLIGWVYGGLTVAVALIALMVVTSHIDAAAEAGTGIGERLAVLP